MSGKTRRYMLYATGEIALVVVGILIALQIENWNSDRQDEATLDSYLQSIARNLRDDLDELEELRDRRGEAILLSSNVRSFLLLKSSFTVEEVLYLARALRAAETTIYFNPNTSGFDALKSSGVLDRLQGRDVEKLLSRYNDAIARVRQLEQDHNTRLNSIVSLPDGATSTPSEGKELPIHNPIGLAEGRFDQLQPFYREYFGSAYSVELFDVSFIFSLRSIYNEYEKLRSLARLFVGMIETGSHDFDDDAQRVLNGLDLLDQSGGNPDVIRNGVVSWGHYWVGQAYQYYVDDQYVSPSPHFDHNMIRQANDAVEVTYNGGLPWAAIYFSVPATFGTYGRGSRDFSRFGKLILEARGSIGGEVLLLNMKDKDDPDDGSQSNIEVVLGDEWQTFEFDLAEFDNADLTSLNLVMSFLFIGQEEPVSFAIRTARFANKHE